VILNVDWATYNLQQFILMQTSQIICHVPFWNRGKKLNSEKKPYKYTVLTLKLNSFMTLSHTIIILERTLK